MTDQTETSDALLARAVRLLEEAATLINDIKQHLPPGEEEKPEEKPEVTDAELRSAAISFATKGRDNALELRSILESHGVKVVTEITDAATRLSILSRLTKS